MKTRRRVATVVLTALALLVAGSSARCEDEDTATTLASLERTFRKAIDRVKAATVVIEGLPLIGTANSWSGVLISSKGVVLSCHDVGFSKLPGGHVWNTQDVQVRIPRADGKGYEVHRGKVVYRHAWSGTSVVVFDHPAAKSYPRLRFGNSDKATLGTFALTAGLARSADKDALPSVNAGVISSRHVDGIAGKDLIPRIYTDASSAPGMEGGPVADLEGRLIGILTQPKTARESLRTRGLAAVAPISSVLSCYRSIEWKSALLRSTFRSQARHEARTSAAYALQSTIRSAATRTLPSVVTLHIPAAPPVPNTERFRGKFVTVPRYRDAFSCLVATTDGLLVTSIYNLCTPAYVCVARTNPAARARIDFQLNAYEDLRIRAVTGDEWKATIIAYEPTSGVVVLRTEAPAVKGGPALPPPLPVCKASDPAPGRFVVVVGNAGAGSEPNPVVTWGILSRIFDTTDQTPWAGQWLTDAGIIDANVGGAAVDLEGRLIGMPTIWSAARHGRNTGAGFIVPWRVIEQVVASTRER